MAAYRTLVVLQPTAFCNIDCRYCYLPDRSNTTRMGLEVVRRISQEVFQSDLVEPPVAFLWHLGEPLSATKRFYENAFQIIRTEHEKTQKPYLISFQTNATLIDQGWLDLILKYQVRLGISLDGPAFIHDRNRVTRTGAPTHARVMESVNLLQAASVPFSVISVITDFTLDYPDHFFDFFLGTRIYDVGFNIDEVEGVHTDSSFCQNLSVGRYRRFLTRLLRLTEKHGGKVKFREAWTNLRTLALGTEAPYNTTNKPYRILNFDVSGNFSTFCPELVAAQSEKYSNFVMGNIMQDSLAGMVSNPIFRRVNQEIEVGLEKCRGECKYWQFCGGGSPSNKFFEHGRFDVTETTTCRIHKKATIDVLVEFLEGRLGLMPLEERSV